MEVKAWQVPDQACQMSDTCGWMPRGHLRKEGWSLVACDQSALVGVQSQFNCSEQCTLWNLEGCWDTLGKYRPTAGSCRWKSSLLVHMTACPKTTTWSVCKPKFALELVCEAQSGVVPVVPTQRMVHVMVESRKQHAKNHVVRNSAQSSWPAGRGLATRACSRAQFLTPQKGYNQNKTSSWVQSSIIWDGRSISWEQEVSFN